MMSPVQSRSNQATVPTLLYVLITSCLTIQPLSTDTYLPALPLIGEYFRASPTQVQHTLSMFILSFACSQLMVGPITDRYGRKPVLLAGLVTFLVASVIGAIAPTLTVLVAARMLQAFGVACAVLGSRAMVRDLYEPQAGAQVLAKTNTGMAFAIVLGPLLGGLLSAAFGWRSSFVMLSLCGAFVLLLCLLRLQETLHEPNLQATNVKPLLLNYAAILRNPVFQRTVLVFIWTYALIFLYLSGTSYVFVKVLKEPVQAYGYYWVLASSGFLIGSFTAPQAIKKRGLERTLRLAAWWPLVGGLLMSALALNGVHHALAISLPMAIVLFGHSRINPSLMALCTAPFPANAGAAAAMAGFLMHVVAALVGWGLARSFNYTVYPLTLSIGLAGGFLALTIWTLIRPGILELANSSPNP